MFLLLKFGKKFCLNFERIMTRNMVTFQKRFKNKQCWDGEDLDEDFEAEEAGDAEEEEEKEEL